MDFEMQRGNVWGIDGTLVLFFETQTFSAHTHTHLNTTATGTILCVCVCAHCHAHVFAVSGCCFGEKE